MKTSKIFKLLPLTFAFAMALTGCNGGNKEKEPTMATITVVNGTGGGQYEVGKECTITATVPEYKSFDYWEKDVRNVSTDNPYTFVVTKDETYKANFKNQTGTLTVINGAGSGTYDLNTRVTVSSQIAPGSHQAFNHWEIDGVNVSTDDPYTFTFLKDTTITAVLDTVNPIAACTSTVIKKHNQDFKILTLTDIQLHDGEDINANLAVIDDTVSKANPDMIVFLGDLINDHKSYKSVVNYKKVIEKFESYEIPWAPVFGNHDFETYQAGYASQKTTTSEDLVKAYQAAEHCIFKVGPGTVDGISNYLINIVDEETGKPVQSLVMLDSYLSGVTDTHAQFYEDCCDYAKELNDGNYVETIVCSHIALPQYGDAYAEMQSLEYRNVTGVVGRNPCDLATGSIRVFDSIKALGNCHNVICGHDHENAYWTNYVGVKLAYSMKSSYGDGHNNPAALGGAMYTVSSGVAELEYVHSTQGSVITGDLAVNFDHVGYWRYSGATLKFDIEYLNESNTNAGRYSLMGTNVLRYSVAQKDQYGMWNRLTGYASIKGNRTVSYGSLTQIEGNKYEYSVDLTTLPLNNGSGEVACGEETLRMMYFDGFSSSNSVRVSNFRFEYENITETDQYDLENATISEISDQFYSFGEYVRPAVTVKAGATTLKAVDDIQVIYSNNKEVGQGCLTVVPSGKGAHRYKGSKTATFNIVVNPDADTVPGHENAKIINGGTGFDNKNFTTLNDWYNSGKSLYFEAKRLTNGSQTSGETFRFALFGQNSNEGRTQNATSDWNRLSLYYNVDLSAHTVRNGSNAPVGTVTDLGDGWYSYCIPLNSFLLNSTEGAMGNANETLTLIYFDNVSRSFKLDSLGVY